MAITRSSTRLTSGTTQPVQSVGMGNSSTERESQSSQKTAYECLVCKKSAKKFCFVNRHQHVIYHLSNDMQIHRYHCSFCSYRSSTQTSVAQHGLRKHGNRKGIIKRSVETGEEYEKMLKACFGDAEASGSIKAQRMENLIQNKKKREALEDVANNNQGTSKSNCEPLAEKSHDSSSETPLEAERRVDDDCENAPGSENFMEIQLENPIVENYDEDAQGNETTLVLTPPIAEGRDTFEEIAVDYGPETVSLTMNAELEGTPTDDQSTSFEAFDSGVDDVYVEKMIEGEPAAKRIKLERLAYPEEFVRDDLNFQMNFGLNVKEEMPEDDCAIIYGTRDKEVQIPASESNEAFTPYFVKSHWSHRELFDNVEIVAAQMGFTPVQINAILQILFEKNMSVLDLLFEDENLSSFFEDSNVPKSAQKQIIKILTAMNFQAAKNN